MIDFDTPSVNADKVNMLKPSELQIYKKGYNPLNPYRIEDKVILYINHHDRFELIEGITETSVGGISEVLGNNMVNISYWDTHPSVIKNVPITSIRLAGGKLNSFKTKVRVLLIKLLRKFKNPNIIPKNIWG